MSKRRGPGGYALGALIAGLTALVVLSFLVDLGLPTYRLQLAKIPVSYPVTNHGREWEYASGDQAFDISRVVTATDRLGPGHPNLLVGTQDLSRTPYVDDSLYFLLPQFREVSHFLDFHPGVALHHGRQLAADVAAANVLILARFSPDGPNASRQRGDEPANEIVHRDFLPVVRAGIYAVYERR